MTTETVKAVAGEFLTRDAPGVLVLKGAWGVGKTYAWHEIVKAKRKAITPPNYSYVSLFGVRSISDLRMAILSKATVAEKIGEPLKPNTDLIPVAKSKMSAFVRRFGDLIKPYGLNVNMTFEALSANWISDTVICLDDFERSIVKAEELLGFVSELKEEKRCKVVLIFNENKLADRKEAYTTYREKVVDIELLYQPTAQEAADLAFPTTLAKRELAIDRAVQLGMNNIRILRRASEVIALIAKETQQLHPLILEQVIATTVLSAAIFYGESDDRITLEFLKHWNALSWQMKKRDRERTGDEANKSLAEKDEWADRLYRYGYLSSDELDLSIMQVVQNGYMQETGLVEAAREKSLKLKGGDLHEAFGIAWRKFHDSFSIGENELLDDIEATFKAGVSQISPTDLDATVILFRKLGAEARADSLIDIYVAAHAGDKKVFDLRSGQYVGDVKDDRVKQRFSEQLSKIVKIPSLHDALHAVSGNRWAGEDIQALMNASEDDYYEFFKADHGRDLHSLVKTALGFKDSENAQITERAKGALARIAADSELNRLRVERFKIAPTKPDSVQGDKP